MSAAADWSACQIYGSSSENLEGFMGTDILGFCSAVWLVVCMHVPLSVILSMWLSVFFVSVFVCPVYMT